MFVYPREKFTFSYYKSKSGRRREDGTPLIVLQVCWLGRAVYGTAVQSDTAALPERSSAELAALGWEKPLAGDVWGVQGRDHVSPQ